MKLKSKVLGLATAAAISISAPTFASAATHTNVTNDKEAFVVYNPSGGVLVPFALAITMNMNITVNTSGKIVTDESIYTTIPGGAQLPFSASVNAGTIKYYKNGTYVFTHSLPLSPSYVKSPSDLADYNAAKPNTDLADTATYKAIGYASFISTSTTPAAYTGDLTEGVVD
ncbi:hypothetical protein V5E38_23495 [Rossellomorea sp. GAMAL-10_SWC]